MAARSTRRCRAERVAETSISASAPARSSVSPSPRSDGHVVPPPSSRSAPFTAAGAVHHEPRVGHVDRSTQLHEARVQLALVHGAHVRRSRSRHAPRGCQPSSRSMSAIQGPQWWFRSASSSQRRAVPSVTGGEQEVVGVRHERVRHHLRRVEALHPDPRDQPGRRQRAQEELEHRRAVPEVHEHRSASRTTSWSSSRVGRIVSWTPSRRSRSTAASASSRSSATTRCSRKDPGAWRTWRGRDRAHRSRHRQAGHHVHDRPSTGVMALDFADDARRPRRPQELAAVLVEHRERGCRRASLCSTTSSSRTGPSPASRARISQSVSHPIR